MKNNIYDYTKTGDIYKNENGTRVILFSGTVAKMLNDQAARIAALEAALRDVLADAQDSGNRQITQATINKAAALLK